MNKKRQFGFWINKFLKCLVRCLVYGALIFVAYVIYKTFGDNTIVSKDKYVIYVTSIMSIGLLIAYKQIVSGTDLSRRQLSMTESIRILKELRQKRQSLESFTEMDYSQEMQKGHSIPYQDIHTWICKKENGLYVGEQGEYELTENGKKIKNDIRAIINDYEYLSIGILNSAFDEQIIKDGMDAMAMDSYKSFSNYIEHIRNSESPDFAVNFEWLVERWTEKKKNGTTRD